MMYVNKKRILPFTLMEFEEGDSGESSPEEQPEQLD